MQYVNEVRYTERFEFIVKTDSRACAIEEECTEEGVNDRGRRVLKVAPECQKQ